jgi:hypothetical protein
MGLQATASFEPAGLCWASQWRLVLLALHACAGHAMEITEGLLGERGSSSSGTILAA